MELFNIIVLAIVQGLTEWFPISSSGHLLLFEKILNYSGGLSLEVALHLGTLIAVFVYFRKDIVEILRDLISGKWSTKNSKLGLFILIGSIPVALIGFLVKDYFDTVLSDLLLTGAGFMVTGIMLLIVGFFKNHKNANLTYVKSFIIGIAQAIAILPSISRSGATIATGIFSGLSEKDAMKFSFLLSIPAILGANMVVGPVSLSFNLVIGTIVAFIVGLSTIHLCFEHLLSRRRNFAWFGIYALIIGIVICVLSLFNL
jgi:undecaprenyl-diphosphatase